MIIHEIILVIEQDYKIKTSRFEKILKIRVTLKQMK